MRLCCTLVLLFFSLILNGQTTGLKYIEDYIQKSDTSILLEQKKTLFIFNGVFVSKGELAQINLIESPHTIDFLIDLESTSFHNMYNSVLVIINTYSKGKKKEIKKIVKAILEKYEKPELTPVHLSPEEGTPVLVINGAIVNHKEFWKSLRSLEVKNIFNIGQSNKAPTSIYGQFARNGIIFIWTKNYANSKF